MHASTRRAVQRLFRRAVDPALSISTADVSTALGITEASALETLEALATAGGLVSTARGDETWWRLRPADSTEPRLGDVDVTQSQPAEATWTDALVDQLLDLSAAGVVLCDETGAIVRSNQRARDLLRTDETEDTSGLVGTRPWDELTTEDGTPFEPWDVADDGASTTVVEGTDGKRYTLSVTLVDDSASGSAQLLVSVDTLASSTDTDNGTDGYADTLVAALRAAISVASEATTRENWRRACVSDWSRRLPTTSRGSATSTG